jgi:ABC-type multidrug transport system permease subunit
MTSLWTVARAVGWRNLRNTLARPAVALPPMIIPLVFFATFAGGLSALGRAPGFAARFPSGYVSFQFVFVWLQGSAFQGMFSGFLIARDFESGFAQRLLIAAPDRRGIVVGYLLSTLARAGVMATILFGVGLLVGMNVDGSVFDLLALIAIGLALTTIAALWSAGVALRLRSVQAGPLMQVPVFLALFLAPVFVPLALLRGWIRGPARVNPVSVFLEQGRNLIAGTNPRVAFAFAVALIAVVVMSAWSLRGLRSAERPR